jgi:curved DNA-binding protein CbpA
MRTLYQILGLPRGASQQQVRTAFRTLARRFHPDVNAANPTAEQHFKEVNRAYETLADPAARAAYDRALVCRQVETRRRVWTFAATASTTFALTTGIALAVWWAQHASSPQPVQAQAPGIEKTSEAHHGDGAKASPRSAGAVVAPPQGRRASWTTYRNARFGFALKYPADVFALDAGPASDNVRTLVTRDGEAVLRIFAAENAAGTTLASYRRALIEERYAGAVIDHARQRKSWFVLSGTHGDKAFYERVAISCDGRSMHGWQMVFPLSERTLYDLVVDEVHRNYSHPIRPGARCGDQRPRSSQGRAGWDDGRG